MSQIVSQEQETMAENSSNIESRPTPTDTNEQSSLFDEDYTVILHFMRQVLQMDLIDTHPLTVDQTNPTETSM